MTAGNPIIAQFATKWCRDYGPSGIIILYNLVKTMHIIYCHESKGSDRRSTNIRFFVQDLHWPV